MAERLDGQRVAAGSFAGLQPWDTEAANLKVALESARVIGATIGSMTSLTPKKYYPGKAGLAGIGAFPDAISTMGALKEFLDTYRLFRAQAVKLT